MTETTVDNPSGSATRVARPTAQRRRTRFGAYGYTFLAAIVCVGWLLRNRGWINPEDGLGYWLGIVGGSLMLLLLLYPSGKKSSLLQRFGLVKHWFRVHMIIGLVGPALILYHCNFSVAALNSKVALYSMIAVTISGIVGRYFYTRIHRGLYGKRASIDDLRRDISTSIDNSRGLAAIFPKFIEELHTVSAKLIGDEHTRSIGMGHSLSWIFKYYAVRLRLFLLIKNESHARSTESEVLQASMKKLRKTANNYAAAQVGMMRQVAQLAFYERIFSLWHLFHMPLFLLLVVSALFHVLAVHMY
jgi:hypothetical protein